MKQKIATIILISASIILLTFITPSFLKNKQNEVSDNKLIGSHIFSIIAGNIERPIGISTGLSSDDFLIRALEREDIVDEKQMEEMMSSYLTSVKKQFGYIASYVVSEKTKRYYTPNGIAKVVNPETDPYDNWYPMFLDTGLDLQIETDRDQLYDYRWSIFITSRIKDSDGQTLGLCGIALFMDEWQKILSAVEKEYNVKINLVDMQGLVQVDTDFNNIKNAYISEALSDHATPNNFTYTDKGNNNYRMTCFIPSLKWYLVVQGKNTTKSKITISIAIIFIYIFLIISILLTILNHRKTRHHDLVKSSLPEDELTGLPNRNYLKESYGELGVFNTTRYKSLAVFDIDHFKVVNDSYDGDKIILEIVNLAKQALEEKGIMFRWSGDEFVLFLEMPSDEAEIRFKEFCQKAEENLKVTVSVGLVDVDLSVSIKTNYYRAVQACYTIKEAGGNGVGRK